MDYQRYYKKYLKYKKKYFYLKQIQRGGEKNSLELLDENIKKNGTKIIFIPSWDNELTPFTLFELIHINEDVVYENYIDRDIITNFNFDRYMCREEVDGIYSTNNIRYADLKCFKSQGAGSGAYIIELNQTKILKGNQFILNPRDIHEFIQKFKFILEAWVNDILMRYIYSIPKLCDNFVKVNDIFICDKKLPHENPITNSTCEKSYLNLEDSPIKVYGFISMEIIDGTLGNFIKMSLKLDYGMFFEYLYSKLVAYIKTNIIFTDHENTGNCGYKIVDFCRKYKLINSGNIVEFYVKNKYMVKIFDFDNIKIVDSPTNDNIYHNISDITEKENSDKLSLSNLIINTISDEKQNCIDLFAQQIENFKSNKQISNFIDSIKSTLPDNYKIPPSDGIQIEEFIFEW